MAMPPIQFDRATGVLEGANAWERLAALALSSGSKVASAFSHRGYNSCANLLRKSLSERDIAVKRVAQSPLRRLRRRLISPRSTGSPLL